MLARTLQKNNKRKIQSLKGKSGIVNMKVRLDLLVKKNVLNQPFKK